jgi:diguanylate cyclase (GGDEF)-like protein
MLAACGALASFSVLFPALEHRALLLAFSLAAVAMGAALIAWPALAPSWSSQVMIGMVTVLISLGLAAGGKEGPQVGDLEVFYVLVSIYAFYFFPGRSGPAQVGFAGLAYAAVLWGDVSLSAGLARWATTMTGMVVAGLMVRAMNREVDDLVGDLDATAARDPLTGILNRRGLDERLGIELTRARRTGEPLCVIAVDLDGLKQINDRHGHAAGDEALSLAADVMGGQLRDVDVLARTGGDEFVILLPNCNLDSGAAIAEDLRVTVATAAEEESWPATISLGVATGPPLPLDPEGMANAADAALYRAKALGRNRVARAGRNELRRALLPD